MTLISEYLGSQIYLATVVAPVAIYFLILGLLNSRHNPQLLSARQDLVLLLVALGPLVILPVTNFLSLWAGIAIGAFGLALVALGLILPQKGGAWVIYNLPQSQALLALQGALDELKIKYLADEGGLLLPDEKAFIRINSFPLLRNTGIRLVGGDFRLARQIETRLGMELCDIRTDASPMAMGLLLVATAMLVAPIAMIVHRAPEIVRILTDLVP